jgi:hypothetical protein
MTLNVPQFTSSLNSKQEDQFITTFKNTLYGYVALNIDNPVDYQSALTAIQRKFKQHQYKESDLYRQLCVYIIDFINIEHKIQPYWSIIKYRHGNREKWQAYNNFLLKVLPGKNDYLLVKKDTYFINGLTTRRQEYHLSEICKQLKEYLPAVNQTFVKNLLSNKRPQHPYLWEGSQYAFDYFIKQIPQLSRETYNDSLKYYFRFKKGDAKVRNGGGFEATHCNKPYVCKLDKVISNLNSINNIV